MNERTAGNKKTTAFLSINTQFDNLGDALINRELCRLVADRVDTFIDFSRAPKSFELSMGVTGSPGVTIVRSGFKGLLATLLKRRLAGERCYLFLNPGGLGGIRLPWKARLSAMIYNIILGGLAALGVRICHVGISYDQMPTVERFIAKWRRHSLYSFCVRDDLSFNYVDSIGMPSDKIVPDLSFNVSHPLGDELRTDEINRDKIAFSFRFDGKAADSMIESVVRSVIGTHGNESEYLFVSQVARDTAGMRGLLFACQREGITARLVDCSKDISELLTVYTSCKAIYSNRLHALLLAAHAGAVPYALIARGSQPKIEGMFTDLGMSKNIVFIDDEQSSIPSVTPIDWKAFETARQELNAYFDELLLH